MSSPAPLLRPPIPGNRSNSGTRVPRLGLAIPPSPGMKPVNGTTTNVPELAQLQRPSSRAALPQLRLATPSGTNATPQEKGALQNGRPPPQQYGGNSASGASDFSGHSGSGGFTVGDEKISGPTSASSSSYSALSLAMGLRQPQGTPDPSSAISSVHSERALSEADTTMERSGSMNGLPDLDKLSLEKGRNLDVEDLDDDGWRAASVEKKVIELGSLGEGAGGAVTRCMLKGGKTVFALKVTLTGCQNAHRANPDIGLR